MKDLIQQELEKLDQEQLKQVFQFIAFLKFRARLVTIPAMDETSLCDIVDATANIDHAIAQVTSQAVPTTAIDQQEIFDQILVHQILASYPEKSWSDILPELQQLNLAPLTLEAIAANIEAPVALDLLLEQLNQENAVALLARCYIIAELDCVITERENQIMMAIASKFNIDLKILENAVNAELTKSDPD